MEAFRPEEFDITYFDGDEVRLSHNAGYGKYVKTQVFTKVAKQLYNNLLLQDKTVLELGCAKGFLVEELRALGVEAYGIDISMYALNEANTDTKKWLAYEDVMNGFPTHANKQWDVIISRFFIQMFTDEQLQVLIPQINRISKFQAHYLRDLHPKYHNNKSAIDWEFIGFQTGTKLYYNNKIINVL